MHNTLAQPSNPIREWQASLNIGIRFNPKLQRSVMQDYQSHGPLVIQKPLYPEGSGICHLYVLHPPGGMVTGDVLTLNAQVGSQAHALITTPSAGKVYRTPKNGALQQQIQTLTAKEEATLEWFPQEIILYSGANALLSTQIHLSDQARFIGWEISCLGRPHGQALFEQGQSRQKVQIFINQQLHLNEHTLFDAKQHRFMQKRFGLHGNTVLGTLFIKPHTDEVGQWQAALESLSLPAALISHTQLGSLFIVRYLGHSAEQAKQLFTHIWHHYREQIRQQKRLTPRIWLT